MKTLNNWTRIVVPIRAMDDDNVVDNIDEMTKHCGGVTVVNGDGQWFDGRQMVSEPVAIHTWHHDTEPRDEVDFIISALLEAGEKEVLVTQGDDQGSISYLVDEVPLM